MKKSVWVFGLIAGIIASVFCVVSISYCYRSENFEGNMLLGYASQVVAFSLIFVGVKNYRDKYNGGHISFLNALKVGLLIALVGSTVYVLVWLVDYYVFIPDFLDKFMVSVLDQARASGASATQLQVQAEQMETYRKLYQTPFGVMLATYIEILPTGIVVALITALILKRRPVAIQPVAV